MNTCTSAFDTTLGVYTGAAVNTLTTVASDDDSCAAPNSVGSQVSFAAVASTVYRIAVGGFDASEEGTFTLAGAVVPPTPVTPVVPITPVTPVTPKTKKCRKGFKKVKGKCKKVKKKKKK